MGEVSGVSERIVSRVRRDFAPEHVDSVLEELGALTSPVDAERLQAAVVLAARGDLVELIAQLDLVALDWRDALVNGGVASADWPAVLDRELGRESHAVRRRRRNGSSGAGGV